MYGNHLEFFFYWPPEKATFMLTLLSILVFLRATVKHLNKLPGWRRSYSWIDRQSNHTCYMPVPAAVMCSLHWEITRRRTVGKQTHEMLPLICVWYLVQGNLYKHWPTFIVSRTQLKSTVEQEIQGICSKNEQETQAKTLLNKFSINPSFAQLGRVLS